MPVAYGGGIRSLESIQIVFGLGIEKVSINSYAIENPLFVRQASQKFGNQSIVIGIDVKRKLFGHYEVYSHGGRLAPASDPVEHAVRMEEMGAGEILLTSIDRDGTQSGYDVDLIKAGTQVQYRSL